MRQKKSRAERRMRGAINAEQDTQNTKSIKNLSLVIKKKQSISNFFYYLNFGILV